MKKKVVSMMLALTLVFSEIPAYTSYAAENSNDSVETVEEKETETTETVETEALKTEEIEAAQTTEIQETETEETKNTETTETENTEQAVNAEIKTAAAKRPTIDAAAFHVSENGKAVGSDGVLYDDVVYLSADTVRALDEDIQSVYFEVCDSIAELKAQEDALNGAVIAVDEDGNLHYSISVPTKRLAEGTLFRQETKQNSTNETEEALETEKSESIEESATEEQTETLSEDVKSGDVSSESASTDETPKEAEEIEENSTETESMENGSETETADDKNATEENSVNDDSSETETTEEVSEEDTTAEETSEEKTTAEEEGSAETESTEETPSEEESSEEKSEEGSSEEERSIEESTEVDAAEMETEEAGTEEYVFSAENMELLEYGQEETFEVVDNVKVEPIVDMGFGFDSGIEQFNSTLSSKTYFKNQLDSVEKKIYDAGVNKLTKGTNQFEYAYPIAKINNDYNSGTLHKRTLQAVSAIIMQYPYDMDWMDLSKEGRTTIGVGVYEGTNYLTGNLQLTLGVSPYYNSNLVSRANIQVSKLAEEAQRYAIENYPNDIVYGIVKYFDDWICKNNYYDMIGVYGGNKDDTPEQKEAFYYCHSSYGILLKGYGVCESYALAMTRLLDALGIPNMYATGMAGVPGDQGGHAWNYVQMPDNKWYLQDSTWNDDTNPNHVESYGDYLLCADDGMHKPEGNRWEAKSRDFKFVEVSATKYDISKGGMITINSCNLKVKETAQLTVSADYAKFYNSEIVSSNPKVAKVDKKGKITAVSAGQAIITVTYYLPDMKVTDTCTVNVMQVKNFVSERTKKASDAISVGLESDQDKYITLVADCGDGIYDAEKLINEKLVDEPIIKVPKNNVAEITYDREKSEGNLVVFKVAPLKSGSASYKITLDKKTVTLKVSVGKIIKRDWFQLDADYIVDGKTTYTGKALKPKVVKTDVASEAPNLKFKTTYYDNKDEGTASVVVSGTGEYAGEETFEFKIESIPINENNVMNVNAKTSKIAYNGGVNQAKVTAKYAKDKTKLTLKAGIDYDIIYKINDIEVTEPKEAGTYSIVAIEGKGNFSGRNDSIKDKNYTYEITSNTLNKAKVSFMLDYEATVKFGKNELPSSDYIVEYYKDKRYTEKLSAKPRTKGTYYVKVLPSESAKGYLTGEKKVTLKIK